LGWATLLAPVVPLVLAFGLAWVGPLVLAGPPVLAGGRAGGFVAAAAGFVAAAGGDGWGRVGAGEAAVGGWVAGVAVVGRVITPSLRSSCCLRTALLRLARAELTQLAACFQATGSELALASFNCWIFARIAAAMTCGSGSPGCNPSTSYG
jgi:hypothetical protein